MAGRGCESRRHLAEGLISRRIRRPPWGKQRTVTPLDKMTALSAGKILDALDPEQREVATALHWPG